MSFPVVLPTPPLKLSIVVSYTPPPPLAGGSHRPLLTIYLILIIVLVLFSSIPTIGCDEHNSSHNLIINFKDSVNYLDNNFTQEVCHQ